MPSQQRVQEYLERHKIGALFEEMMAKLIHGMPDEPHAFLHRILLRKAEKLVSGERSQPRSSAVTDVGHRRSVSPQSLRRSLPMTSTGDGLAVAKDRVYDKPWQTNTKRLPHAKGSRTDLVDTGDDMKPGWDSRTRVNFEELWGEGDTKQVARALRATRAGSPTKAVLTWADEQGEDEELLYRSYGYRGVHRSLTNTDDPLAGEFKNAKETRKSEKESNRVVVPSKRTDSRLAALRHKQQLQQMLVEQTKQDSGIEDDHDLDPDNAIELMENLDDLAKEGAKNMKQTGVRVSKTLRQRQEPEAQVRVSICARCAKVMTGGVPSEPVEDYGQLPDYDIDTEREFPDSRPQSALFSHVDDDDDDDEEFESVSQVTGPRRPVWQEDSDADTFTPRKGEHMFSSHNVPLKGRPMFSPDIPETGPRKRKGEGLGIQAAVSTDFYSSPSAERGVDPRSRSHGRLNQTWAPATRQSSENDHEDDDLASPGGLGGGQGWQPSMGYETDGSSYYGGGGVGHGAKSTRSRTYQGAF
ncbi:hypothetical protein LSAT2_025510 [Lamellibrachia satsuma]|nr:hypothetical protein LSAT2_025510 [Lamellibrachia satsuma]